MKRIYMQPETAIVKVELQNMIAVSIVKGGNYNGQSAIESRQNDNFNEGYTVSSSKSVWDD